MAKHLNIPTKLSKKARETVKKEWNAKTATRKLIDFCNAFFEGDYKKATSTEGVLSYANAVSQKDMYKCITTDN